jgi:glycosyltransferase involved in cell wall biosynthesis
MNGRRRAWLKTFDRAIYCRYAKIIAVSGEVRKTLLEWLPELAPKIAVVPNAVDASQFQAGAATLQALRQEIGLQPEQKVVLYAGRLVEVKGVDILLDAVAQLPPDLPVKVLLAGEGPLQEALTHQAAALGIGERVQFLGLRRDMPALLNLADLVVLPSRWEGLPMILLEAMAARKAIIATAVGGVPGVIAQGETGWLIPPYNPAVLAEAMLTLLSSPQLRSVLGEGAYEVVSQHYSAQAAVQKLHNVYRSVLGQAEANRSPAVAPRTGQN